MALTKEQKQKILEDLKEKLDKQKAMIFADFTGLKVKDFSNLRKKLKKEGSELKVAKKTLFGLAFKNAGFEIPLKKMKGEIAAVFGYGDELAAAKTVYQFTETNKNLKILGGIFEQKFIAAEKLIELAKLPTKKELLARLVWSISAPISNFVYVLQGNIKGLITVLAKAKT
ncbi:50S ribosomal protein L10 [Patescibacteria group bacterium]|nr:50S ribosomal protein L10 [Patescibacteria group bacterium]